MTDSRDDMYIGYLARAPRHYRRPLRVILIVVGCLLIISATCIVLLQRPFSTNTFEYGRLTEIEGVLDFQPVPRILLHAEAFPKSVLLVGYGKHGAEATLEAMENRHKTLLDDRRVHLRGTLIYGEGKTFFELTEGHEALLEYGEASLASHGLQEMDSVRLHGQIVDPKCYFGVMKPGEGKVHRACATRCISGGIPPVLKVLDHDGRPQFYLLLGPAGESIRRDILAYVADQVVISGKLHQAQDWYILYIDPSTILVL